MHLYLKQRIFTWFDSFDIYHEDGSVAYSNLNTGGYPGNDVLQNNIEVALTK